MDKLTSLGRLIKAVREAKKIIDDFRPDAVLGVGGYASGPMGLATALAGTPLALAEQNAAPGMTNRWLGHVAKKVFVTWPGSEGAFPGGKGEVTGNPVRPEFFSAKKQKIDKSGRLTIFITGGSQGAQSINNAMIDAVDRLNTIAEKIVVVHQTGLPQLEKVRKAYGRAAFEWEAEAFYDDMPQRLADADLVICRAGAGTVAEVCAVGRTALYVPYPLAADDHQSKNAEAMVMAGAALMMTDGSFTGHSAFEAIRALESNRMHLRQMADNAKEMATPDAAGRIADGLEEMAEGAA